MTSNIDSYKVGGGMQDLAFLGSRLRCCGAAVLGFGLWVSMLEFRLSPTSHRRTPAIDRPPLQNADTLNPKSLYHMLIQATTS